MVTAAQHSARPGAPTAREVLAAAETLLDRHGPAAMSVRRVADAVGVSRQVVYSRFGGKAGLVRALHDVGFDRLTVEVQSVAAEPGTDDHIVGLGLAYRRAALASPAVFDVMFARPFVEFTRDDEARAVAVRSFAPIVAGARTWLDVNRGDHDGAVVLARTLWASVHGVVMLERTGHLSARAATTQIRDATQRILRGSA